MPGLLAWNGKPSSEASAFSSSDPAHRTANIKPPLGRHAHWMQSMLGGVVLPLLQLSCAKRMLPGAPDGRRDGKGGAS